jgi:hypothetical protein
LFFGCFLESDDSFLGTTGEEKKRKPIEKIPEQNRERKSWLLKADEIFASCTVNGTNLTLTNDSDLLKYVLQPKFRMLC